MRTLKTSVPVDSLEDLEDLDEEVDDVQVELNGGGDVLLRGDPGHDHLQTRQIVEDQFPRLLVIKATAFTRRCCQLLTKLSRA